MKAVILAGGKGARLAPYTTVFPKPMLPIGDKPILDTIIKQLAYYGFDEIILSVGYLAELLQAYFTNCNGMPENVKISYVREKHPLGTDQAGWEGLSRDTAKHGPHSVHRVQRLPAVQHVLSVRDRHCVSVAYSASHLQSAWCSAAIPPGYDQLSRCHDEPDVGSAG